MNAVKTSKRLYIGNVYVTELSQEDWDELCRLNNPYVLEDGRQIFSNDKIPVEMQSKYAEIIVARQAPLPELKEKIAKLRSDLWFAEMEAESVEKLQKLILPKVRHMSQAEIEDNRRFELG